MRIVFVWTVAVGGVGVLQNINKLRRLSIVKLCTFVISVEEV